jgi:hypothetical protein
VGHIIQCPCGRELSVPPAPQDVPPVDDTYDLEQPAPQRPVSTPAQAPSDAAVPTAKLASARPTLRYQAHDVDLQSNWRETIRGAGFRHLTLPLLLAALAMALRFGLAVAQSGGSDQVLLSLGIAVGTMAMNTVTLLIAVAIMARFTGAELGPLPLTIIKLACAGILGSLVMGVAAYYEMHSIGIGILAVHVIALLYWVMFSIFFEMDLQETLMTVVIACILQAGTVCLLWIPAAP